MGVDGAQEKNADMVQMKNNNKKSDNELYLGVITGLITMMDQNNPYAKTFRMAKHRMQSQPAIELRLRIISRRQKDARQYTLPTCSEVAASIIHTPTDDNAYMYTIVEHKKNGYTRINEIHPCYMCMQFLLLFPYSEDGYNHPLLITNKYSTNYLKKFDDILLVINTLEIIGLMYNQ